ncbi:hypothetical protein [Streptomyces xylophagus]|uniref:hypothetical protein n=1 Tax=Streptomyces xylophagus TaxID=285514 RepID=UPI001F240BF2|nr:hypothetical protein [Streptomyces xylophagus]
MKSENVIALCAVLIALCSLTVSIYEARASRRHNRNSVRPILQLHRIWHHGSRTGIRLSNCGLGPAIVTSSRVWVDGEAIGPWTSACANRLSDGLSIRPSYSTFNEQEVFAVDREKYLLSVPTYSPQDHADFEALIQDRITVEIRYDSLHGGEGFRTVLTPSS